MELPFLKNEKFGLREQTTFIGEKMEIFIPSYFLDPAENIARTISNRVETVGLFWYKVGNEFYEIQVPVKFEFSFTERSKKRIKLKAGMPEIEYDIFVLITGDAFIYDTNHKQSIDDLNWFISKMIEGAKMPPTVSYDEAYGIFSKALEITQINAKLGVPALTLEFLLSELFRNRKNNSESFRLAYNGKNPYDYRMVRIVKIPEMNSTFTGLLGEDINQQIVTGVLKNREGKEEKISPIEKIIKY